MKLKLLGGESEDFNCMAIFAYEILDNVGNLILGCNSRREAIEKKKRLEILYPEKKFYLE